MRAFPIVGFTLLSLGLGMGPVLAEAASNPSSISPSSEQNTLTGNVLGSGFNPMQLIHNANLMNGRDSATFNQEASENISDAAADYKTQLLQWWQQQKGTNNPSAAVSETPTQP